ncbi:MAG: prolyl oligopeptidase family serine peptidase [Pseudomonadota bacterium]
MLSVLAAAVVAASFDPAAAFGRLPFFDDIEVSPKGERFAAIASTNGQTGLAIYELTGGQGFSRFVTESENLKVRNFFWKRDDRLVFSIAVPSSRYGTDTVETRLLAMSPDDDDIDALFRHPRDKGTLPVQIQDRVVSAFHHDPEHIVVEYYPKGSQDIALYRVNVDKSGRHRQIEGTKIGSRDFYTDAKGEVRAWSGLRGERLPRLSFMMADGKWRDFSHRVAEDQPNFRIAGFPNSPNKAFVLSDHETPTMALYVFDIDTDSFGQQLFSHPTADVYGVRQRISDGAAYGAVFAGEDSRVHYFSDNIIRDMTKIIFERVGGDNVSFRGMNPQQTMAVFYVSYEGRPGRNYIFDIENMKIIKLPPLYPELENVPLGQVISASYKARDGLTIPAYVTLPPGVSTLAAARNLPFVVLPHGGPNARNFSGFDWRAQYLAHKGYGILQMNFRGSTGYGAEFMKAGDKEWGQAMQDDITDGTRWLIDQGMADPDRLVIMGGSYGGYAALMGAVKTPDLFTCAISINGVSNLLDLVSDRRSYVDGAYSTRHIGRLWGDRAMLRENSPSRQADAINVPVLLIAGEDDRVVPADQSSRMHRAIKNANGQSTLVKLPEGNHYLSVGQNRITALRAIGDFLPQCQRS